MKNTYTRFFLGASVLIGLLSGCAARVKGPGIVFASEKYDFGTVEEGSMVQHVFEFTNNGTEKLVIDGVIPTCGCTTIESFDKEAPAGGGGKIAVSLNTK